MEKNKKNKAKGGKNMARGEQAPSDPVSVLENYEVASRSLMPPPSAPPKKKPLEHVEEPGQHMVTLKPKFLPNLKDLMFPKMVYEQAERLVITPLLANPHDPVAAAKLRGARCSSFELPENMFPSGAPVWKITYLPQELLPMGFDAGGVFGTGVLARKYYPTDLLSADHKGQTPPLFIGHRSSSFILPKGINAQAKAGGNGKGRGQIQAPPKRIKPLTPAPPPSPPFVRSILKPSAAVTAEMDRLLVLHNFSVLVIMPVIVPVIGKPQTRYPSAVPIQMQYNMYAPDMSKVIFAMQDIGEMVVAILSTVHQPNVPEVALSTMDNEPCPKFELPPDIFPTNTNRMGPRFLPERFLPYFCDAGCVYAPGSLPDSVFQGAIRNHYDCAQHHYTMTPPLFVGRRRPQPQPQQEQQQQQEQQSDNENDSEGIQVYKIESIAMQLKRLDLNNIAAAARQNTTTPVPLPESTKRTNDFKLAAAGGKPKGFVLIESDHVPRGAIRTDFFGAFLMGCFFKIIPETKCLYDFSSEEDEEDYEDGEDLQDLRDIQDAMKQLKMVLKEDKAIQAEEAKAEQVEAPEADVDSTDNTEAEKAEVEELARVQVEIEVEADVNSEDYETEEYLLDEECECESEDYEAEEVDFSEYLAAKGGEIEEYDSEQTEGVSPLPPQVVKSQHMDLSIQQPVAKNINLKVAHTDDDDGNGNETVLVNENGNKNDNKNENEQNEVVNTASPVPVCPGCLKIFSYFTVDSNLDDIAEAAGNLDTARFEVIVHPSELPGMNVEIAVEQFRQVLKVRNQIRATMTGKINEHIAKMEAANEMILASNAPSEAVKRVLRKACSHCGKNH